MNREESWGGLIGGLFESHIDRDMEAFLLSLQQAGFVPVAGCRGHHPLISGRGFCSMIDIFHPRTPEPFLFGWPPFVCFSGEEDKVREFFRRIRESIATHEMKRDWRLMGIMEEVKDGRKWLLFDAAVYRAFWGFSLRRRRLMKDLRTMEGLLEGLNNIVPEGDGKEIQSVQDDPGPILGVGIVFKRDPELEDNIENEKCSDQKNKSFADFSEKGHRASRKSPERAGEEL